MSRPTHASLLALAASALLGLSSPAHAQDGDLRWSFKEGDTLHYLLTQESTTKTNFQGNALVNKNDQSFDMTWKVKGVKPDGSAELAQTFDRIRFKAEGINGAVSFDSMEDKALDPNVEALAKVFRALIGAEITLTMTPAGETKDIKLPAKAVDALNSIPVPPGGQRMLSEDSFKNIIELATLPLPGKPTEKGANWAKTRENASPLGTMTVDTTYTLQGPAETEKALDQIGLKAALKLNVKPDLPVKATIKSQEVQGLALFDRKAGHLKSSKLDQTVELDLEAMGRTIQQETITKIAITEQDAAKK